MVFYGFLTFNSIIIKFAFRLYPLSLTDICHAVGVLYLFLLSSNRHVESYILSIWVENEGINFAFFADQSVKSLKKNLFPKKLVTLSNVLMCL